MIKKQSILHVFLLFICIMRITAADDNTSANNSLYTILQYQLQGAKQFIKATFNLVAPQNTIEWMAYALGLAHHYGENSVENLRNNLSKKNPYSKSLSFAATAHTIVHYSLQHCVEKNYINNSAFVEDIQNALRDHEKTRKMVFLYKLHDNVTAQKRNNFSRYNNTILSDAYYVANNIVIRAGTRMLGETEMYKNIANAEITKNSMDSWPFKQSISLISAVADYTGADKDTVIKFSALGAQYLQLYLLNQLKQK